jgi:copper resistance protein D
MPIDPQIVVRALHFASTVIVAGSVIFGLLIAGPVRQRAEDRLAESMASFRRQNTRLLWLGLFIALFSGAVRLVLVAADITGETSGDVIGNGMVWTVLIETQFGFVTQLRLVLAVILVALVLWSGRWPHHPVWLRALILMTAALFLGSLAWAGHASGAPGVGGGVHLASDILHVLAAGAWVGGLVPLLLFLEQPSESPDGRWFATCGDVLRRFSTMGVVSVAALAASGVLNTWFLTDRMRALFGTDYGRLVQLKIALFLAMLCVAAVNRLRLLPRISPCEDPASLKRNARTVQQLRRNTALEIALGLAVLYVVGVLGVTPPAGHIHSASVDEHSWRQAP